MQKKILFELFNLTLARGTGIATYARNLCALANQLGFDAEGLLHSNRPIDPKDPVLAEIAFFDARNRSPDPVYLYTTMMLRRLTGLPFGLPSLEMPKRKIVTPTAAQDPFQGLSRLHVATLFMDATRYHFKLYGRSAKLRVKARPDIFHATQAIPLRVEGARNIYTIHDVVPLKLPQSTLDDKKFFLNMVRHLGATADRIVTVSEASRRDLIDICGVDPNRVVNTYQSVSFPKELLAQTYAESATLVRRAFGLDADDYYLFFGALEPKKNVGRLLDSYIVSGTKRKLALAGGLGWEYDDDLAKIEDLRSHALKIDGARITPDEQIRRLSHVPLFQLTALIRCARAVVFPSLYEGFGLPVLEAMLLGAPVLTSNGSSLPEVAGDAALLVDPTDVRSIAGALRRLDEDDALCADLRQRGYAQAAKFSPGAHKERLARVYDEALASPPRQNTRAA